MDDKIKRILILTLIASLTASPVLAADPDRQTLFNSVTDFFATVGKSDKDKKEIKRMRKKMRRDYRMQKERIRKREATQDQIKKQQKIIEKKYNKGNTKIGL